VPLRPDLRNLRDANGDLVYRGRAWKARRERLLERCGNKCERCRKPNQKWVWVCTSRHGDCGQYWTEFLCAQRWFYCLFAGGGNFWLSPYQIMEGKNTGALRRIWVILTMAHLTHDPLDNDDADLAMLCQWCHLNYDKVHHRDTRCERKDRARPLLRGVA